MINWFAVHCTSMNNTNSLISGDNKGGNASEPLVTLAVQKNKNFCGCQLRFIRFFKALLTSAGHTSVTHHRNGIRPDQNLFRAVFPAIE